MGSFSDDTAVRREGDGLRATLAEEWGIWGPNGGYIAAIALRAAGTAAPEGHRPATFSCQYLSTAAFADVEIEVDPVRQGRSAWCLNVVLTQGGKRFLQAQVWTTNRTEGPEHLDVKPPAVPPPSALKPFWDHVPDQPVHPFWAHFEGRPVKFLPLYTPDPEGAVSRNWQKFLDFDGKFEQGADAFLDAARCLILIDTMPWPTFHRSLTAPPAYIAPSLDLAVWFHEPANGAEWLLVDAYADTGTAGLIHGGGRIWTEDGRLIATGGSQLMVVSRGG